MTTVWNRTSAFAALVAFAAVSFGQARTIEVSSPVTGDFLGKSNTVSFNIKGAKFNVHLVVQAKNNATGQTVSNSKDFQPNGNNEINDSIPLNFSDSATQGAWTVFVIPHESDGVHGDFSYNGGVPVKIPVTVDVKSPAFYTINPLNNAYVKGTGVDQIVHINATLNEPNIDKWTVEVNGGGISNNTGDTPTVNVDWSAKGIQTDGPQTIVIKVDDKAKNTASRSVTVNLDRIRPNCRIVTPGPTTVIPPNTNIPVLIEIKDQFSDSVDVTGVDVVVKSLQNKFIARVARQAVNSNGTTLSWSGRIRSTAKIPNEFKIVVTALDKAGNVAVVQETRVKIGNR